VWIDLEPRQYTVTIPAFQTYVIAHSSLMTWFSSWWHAWITYQSDTLRQRIRDDQRLTAVLYAWWIPTTWAILDILAIPRSSMLIYDNQQRSWERIRTDTGWVREIGNDARITGRVQKSTPHKGNPWFVRSATWQIIFPHIPASPILTCDQSIMIEEIHKNDEYVSNYVDIVIMTGFIGSFSISGWWIWATWTGTFAPGQHVLLHQWSLSHPLIQNVSSLSLNAWTTIQILRNGIIIDQITVWSWQGTGQSLYASSTSCGRVFDLLAPSTPFMDQALFPLNPRTEVIVIHTQPPPNPPSGWSCPQCQLCQNTPITWMITDSWLCMTGVNIMSTLSTSPLFINAIYATGWLHRVSITNGWPSDQSLLWYSLRVWTLSLHTRMTWVLDSYHSLTHNLPLSPLWWCYQLLHMGIVRSTLCFDPSIHGHGIICQWPSMSPLPHGSTWWIIPGWWLRLVHVDYAYPSWQPQAVTISLAESENSVNLTQYRLRVNNNSTRLTITWAIINPWQTRTIWRSFNFPRVNPTTIHLLHLTWGTEILVDSYFYDPSSPLPPTTGILNPPLSWNNPPLSWSQQPPLSWTNQWSWTDQSLPLIPDLWDIRIQSIDYAYPSWQPQSITLFLASWASSLPLWQFRLRVNQNQTRLTITWATLMLGEPLTVWRSFNFPRTTATTVHLLFLSWSTEIPLTSYFYDPNASINDELDDNIMTGSILDPRNLIVRFDTVIWDTPSWVDQTVSLRLFTGADRVSLSRFRIRVNDNTTRTTLWSDDLILWASISVTRNFRFPKTRPTTLRLLYLSWSQEIHLDTYDYNPSSSPDPNQESASVDLSSLVFRIKEVVYDPPGSDTGNEVVVIEYLQWPPSLDASDFRVRVNGSNKTINGELILGTNRFQKTFWFPNTKKTCIEFIHAQTSTVFDTLCYDPEQETNEETSDEWPIELRIVSLVYDVPPRTDQRITLLYSWSAPNLSLTSYSLLINGRRRLLRNFGPLPNGQETELLGNFGFLKTKDTCVSLARGETVFDTRCYSPAADKEEKKNRTDPGAVSFAILSLDTVMPNPQWRDDNEQIHLRLLSWTLPVDLFHYIIMTDKGKRITIRGTMTGDTIRLLGSFGLPNTATYLTLHHKTTPTIPMARLCYPNTQDNILYDGTQAMLLSATQPSPYRMTYSKGIVCLYVNNKKTECFDRVLEDYHRLRLATQYINELQSELIYNFPTLRFYSGFHPMAVLYREHLWFIDQKMFTITRRWVSLPVSSFGDHYDVHYGQRMEGLVMDGVMKLFE